MKKYTVGYVGNGMSGRSTSVAAVVRSTGMEVSRITDGWNEQLIPIHRDRTVVARVSVKRGRLFYASSGEAPATVQEEIDWLCQADGIVFVVDSQKPCAELNTIQLARLRNDLWVRGVDLDDVPVVFQANKRDLPNLIPMGQIQAEYKTRLSCVVESIATRSIGTLETVQALVAMIGRNPRTKAAGRI